MDGRKVFSLMITDTIKKNRFIHFFTNSFLFGNKIKVKGQKNNVFNRRTGLSLKSRIRINGTSNSVDFSGVFKFTNSEIFIKGHHNKITFGKNVNINDAQVWVIGENNHLFIGKDCIINNTEFGLQGVENAIKLNDKVYVGGFVWLDGKPNKTERIRIYTSEGKKIEFGTGTVLSEGVAIRSSDSHPIFDSNDNRTNLARDITVGEKVWICTESVLLKGAKIGNNSIVAYRSLVTKDFSEHNNVVLGGSPAKIINTEIDWDVNEC